MVKKQIKLIPIKEARHFVVTPILVVSFPVLFEPRSFGDDPSGKKSFQVDLIADSNDVWKEPYKGKKKQTVSMMQAVVNVKKDQWGLDKSKWPKFNYPVFKDGSERKNAEGEIYEGYEDKVFVTAKSDEKYKPIVIDKTGKPLDAKDVYGGCLARAELIARPYAFGKNFGVRFIIKSLMKIEDGDRFGGVSGDSYDFEEDDTSVEEDFDESDSDDEDDF